MTADQASIDDFALRLRQAELDGTSVPLATERFTSLDWSDARRIALARDALRLADGDELIGYKLGWTSAAMREALGIDRPNWGTLWRSQRLDRPLDLGSLRHGKVEPEVVFVADRELVGASVTVDDVMRAARGWAVGIEVVHPRWPSYDFTWLDNTADNSSAHAIAMGTPAAIHRDLADIEIRFSNGVEERSGRGERAMGSPAEAVAWLARALAAQARTLQAGHIVFTGGITAPFDVVDSGHFTAQSAELGIVDLDVALPRAASPEGT